MEAVTKFTPCPKAGVCGGCRYQEVPYAEQLARKEARVRRLMGRFGPVLPILGMDEPRHYRCKVQAAFGVDGRGRVISGVYQSGSHRIVAVDDCLIEDAGADRIIRAVRQLMPKCKMPAYDERRGTGFLRHVLVRVGRFTGEYMVVLVAAAPVFPGMKHFLKGLLETCPEINTVVLNVNDRATSMVLGQRERVLYGKGWIEDEILGRRFRISPRSFYQVNPVQTQALYQTALDYAGLTGTERVLDAYCGTGTIGICASDRAAQVAGVELNRDAVRDAIANARRNGVRNCWFTCADAGEFMERSAEAGEGADVVFLDPPRAGSDARFLASLLRCAPGRVVYISCNPDTLARDTAVLVRGGYRVERVQPVDLFPFTEHVETVCLLSKLSEAKHHISVQVDMDELDLTAAESKATYEEIQAWVQEKYGFHVTHLNIAKTKRKCGIIERQNYNLPKNKDSRSPETPKEKEKAIIEAFKAFRMI